jgi:uncharacterized membrane protein
MSELDDRELFIYRTLDKRDKLGLLGVYNKLVDEGGVPKNEALAWAAFVGPSDVKRTVASFLGEEMPVSRLLIACANLEDSRA